MNQAASHGLQKSTPAATCCMIRGGAGRGGEGGGGGGGGGEGGGGDKGREIRQGLPGPGGWLTNGVGLLLPRRHMRSWLALRLHGRGEGQEQKMEEPSKQHALVEGQEGWSDQPYQAPALHRGSYWEGGREQQSLHCQHRQRVLLGYPSKIECRPYACRRTYNFARCAASFADA